MSFEKAIKFAIENIALYKRAVTKNYVNVSHILREDYEVLVPADNESYTFDKNVWNIVDKDEYVVIVKKNKS